MEIDPKEIVRKKFIFAIFALIVATGVTVVLHYEGNIYVQLFGVVVTGYLIAQAYVDSKKP